MGATPPRPPRRQAHPAGAGAAGAGPRHGLARVLSKAGLCSRTEAAQWIRAGRVRVDGRIVRDPEHPLRDGMRGVQVEGLEQAPPPRRYVMLNKPRGLVTTARDEQGRDTVYRCFDGAGLPWLAPVGRLDKASEGLLLFSNDPGWAARVLDPGSGPGKTYHVQVDRVPDAALLAALAAGAVVDGERLPVGSPAWQRAYDAAVRRAVATIRAHTDAPVFWLDVPCYRWAEVGGDGEEQDPERLDIVNRELRRVLADDDGITVVDYRDRVCGGADRTVVDFDLRPDGAHLTEGASQDLWRDLEPLLDEALGR